METRITFKLSQIAKDICNIYVRMQQFLKHKKNHEMFVIKC